MGCSSSKKKLTKADLAFLEENTEFTREQITEWYEGFILDCPTGELTKKKFIQVYRQFFPNGQAEAFCTHIFRTFDADNSGKIDFKEFLMAINITGKLLFDIFRIFYLNEYQNYLAKGNPEKKLKWAFKMYDIDSNGSVDRQEMLRIIESIYDLLGAGVVKNASNGAVAGRDPNDTPESRTAQIFAIMDEDNNGVITEEEFIRGCMADRVLYQMLTADTSDPER
ncbi:unnamed protein product [Adineta steineri]|uniref:EF-hand domain-containing protein n=1 Tax=Adineta steineri TaxID=433720 RepID=A0A814DMT0_9BILA|nr:unnamed protein product [Adineta steineri]CAF1368826.1 unnamed protein product [Adineta steineri]